MITIMIAEIQPIIQGLIGIGKVKFGSGCKRRALIKHIANNWLTAFQAELRTVEQTRLELMSEFQIKDEKGNPKTKTDADGRTVFDLTDEDAWNRHFQDYLKQNIEINVNKIEIKIPMDTDIDGLELQILVLMATNEDIFIDDSIKEEPIKPNIEVVTSTKIL